MFQKLKLFISLAIYPPARSFAKFFAFLAAVTVGHDIYLWQMSDGFPFAFAATGWITKTYIPTAHYAVVDFMGAPLFNSVFTPVLKIPAAFLAGGISLAFMVVGFILQKRQNAKPPPKRPRPQIQ